MTDEAQRSVANQSIPITTTPFCLLPDDRITGQATVALRMLPQPSVEIDALAIIDADDASELLRETRLGGAGATSRVIRLLDLGVDVDLIITSDTTRWPDKHWRFLGVPASDQVSFPITGTCERVEFHVLNLPQFIVRFEDGDVERHTMDLTLPAGDWVVRLRRREDTYETIKALNASGGYAPTHHGTLARSDGAPFTVESTEEVLDALRNFLSFARGFWTGIALPVAYGLAGDAVWAEWRADRTSSWTSVRRWTYDRGGALLADTFAGFWSRWGDAARKEALQLAIYWYVGSNEAHAGIEGSIMLSQTALELLAWDLLVKERAVISAAAFSPGKLQAADRVRLLLSMLGIPLSIPPELTELTSTAKQLNWVDGPQALVALRNSIVHPGEARAFLKASGEARIEAWSLAQWYIELVLLQLCGHHGSYANRLTGRVDRVPWATDPQ